MDTLNFYWHHCKQLLIAHITIFVFSLSLALLSLTLMALPALLKHKVNYLIGTTMEYYTGNIYGTLFKYKVI